ncbi:LamG-like jellyroll fold domain-containing protein [Peribacillus sp. SI8-4]|uniref:LamG-like jellyroll fold domain-containing protein n=1 Tax=Peribacillus sp. SI8-4 TaxID=3048009 RepID=UPI002552148E|nr:LamG-like jellyroll fold domain-containing protein [Peribacillus sp. SI8-4]
MKMKKAFIGLSLLFMIVPGIANSANSIHPNADDDRATILADWKFTRKHVKSGSIENGDLMIEDTSKNGNDLEMVTMGNSAEPQIQDLIQWSEEDYHERDGVDSLKFANQDKSPSGRYFRTRKGAPINSENFDEGFTLEVIFKLPSKANDGLGLFSRQGKAANLNKMDGEKKMLSALTVSSDQKIHWTSHPSNLTYNVSNWSRSLNADEWYHLAVVNDGIATTLTLNDISDYGASEKVIGIASLNGKGWNIGASEWGNKVDKLFTGNIEEIRIANKALTKKDWLVQNPRDDNPFEGSNKKLPFLTNRKNYNFVFIPDTQKYSSQNPEIFHSQMNWLSKNSMKNHIIMNTFVGDIVDGDTERQWQNSLEAISKLDKYHVPYMMAAGNHDYASKNPFLTHYGPHRFQKKGYYKGSSPSRYSSYAIAKAGSYRYLILIVDMKNLHKDLQWAKGVLDQHQEKPTILVSHDIIFPTVKKNEIVALESANGRLIWNELVKDQNQVFMTVNGHYFGIAHQVKKNTAGNDVIQMVVNYQSDYRGGNGWLRLVEFNEKKKQLFFRTYSPYVDDMSKKERTYADYKFLTDANNSFILNWDFKRRFSFNRPKR